jgi:hypothetical protein
MEDKRRALSGSVGQKKSGLALPLRGDVDRIIFSIRDSYGQSKPLDRTIHPN